MTREYWIAVSVGAFIVGIIVGYTIWGSTAAKVPEVERELTAARTQLSEFRQKSEKLESNLGKITNERLNLERENVELKEALEKSGKGGR